MKGGEAMAISRTGAFLSLLIVFFIAALRYPSGEASVTTAKEFDYFLLSLQWPGTYCPRTRYCCPKNGCCRSLPLTEFTIHGLWPNYNDGTWPSCCSGSNFDAKKISSLIPVLEKYWPTLSCSSSSLCHGGKGLFWEHEWEKHGTCSYPVIKDEYSYFSTVLDLYYKYNITRVLTNAGFLATNSEKYPLEEVVTAVKKSVGASPELVCRHGSIEELRLCFSKDFKPRDCQTGSKGVDRASNSRSYCPRFISLPTYAPFMPEDANPTSTPFAKAETFSPLAMVVEPLVEIWLE